jgi:hypothetical protein
MSPDPVQITIPKPCEEDFGPMPTVEGGKFCGQCSQVVVDFTRMTDAQLIDWMQNHRGGCGTFRRDQLNRDLIAPVVRKAPFGMGWLLSLLIIAGCIREENGQKVKRHSPGTEQRTKPEDEVLMGEAPMSTLGNQPDTAQSGLENDTAAKLKKHLKRPEKRPELVDGMIGDNVMGGVPVAMDPLNAAAAVVPDTAKKRGSDRAVRNVSEINRIDITSGVTSTTDQLRYDQSIRISGARSSGTKFIIDGKQIGPAKKTLWQRVFGHR